MASTDPVEYFERALESIRKLDTTVTTRLRVDADRIADKVADKVKEKMKRETVGRGTYGMGV